MERGRWIWYAAGAVLAAVMLVSVLTIVLADQMRAVDSRVVVGVFAGSAVAVWVAVTFGFRCGPAASLQVLTMLIIVTVALLSVIYTDTVERFAGQSYLAVLILSFVGAATVILPAPAAWASSVLAWRWTIPTLLAWWRPRARGWRVDRLPGRRHQQAIGGAGARLREDSRRAKESKQTRGPCDLRARRRAQSGIRRRGLIRGGGAVLLWRFFALAWLGNASNTSWSGAAWGAVIFRALGSA